MKVKVYVDDKLVLEGVGKQGEVTEEEVELIVTDDIVEIDGGGRRQYIVQVPGLPC